VRGFRLALVGLILGVCSTPALGEIKCDDSFLDDSWVCKAFRSGDRTGVKCSVPGTRCVRVTWDEELGVIEGQSSSGCSRGGGSIPDKATPPKPTWGLVKVLFR